MSCNTTTRVVKMGIDYGNIRILSTADTEQSLIVSLKQKNIFIDVVPLTATLPLVNNYLIDLVSAYATKPILAIFSDAAAVKAVANLLNNQPVPWQIACIEKTVSYAVQDMFPDNKIALCVTDEQRLAEGLIKMNIADTEKVYFCGNKASDTIPTFFRLHNTNLASAMVYQTSIKAAPITEYYNGILFLTESAVDSFFVFNDLPNNTVGFCLSEAVANTLTQKLNQATVVVQAKEPTMLSLIESVMVYYGK